MTFLSYQNGPLSAGLDGIDANSEAVAKADVEQEADQSNKDSKEITRAPTPDGQTTTFQPITVDLQLEAILQANANLQLGWTEAEATSGDVYVSQSGALDAQGSGIVAESKAVGVAELEQKAEQENDNDVSADGGTLTLQGQLAAQINFNAQAGVADADATSGDVTVDQSGTLNAVGDGITAELEGGGHCRPRSKCRPGQQEQSRRRFAGDRCVRADSDRPIFDRHHRS